MRTKRHGWDQKKVFAVNGGDIFIFANGNLRKVPRCNVQLSEKKEEI